jgi:hypothetical protein
MLTIKAPGTNMSIVSLHGSTPRFGLNTTVTDGWTLLDYGTGSWSEGITQVNGNVGIGTTSPAYNLHIQGSPATILLNSTTANANLILNRKSSSNVSRVLYSTDGSYNAAVGLDDDGTSNFHIGDLGFTTKWLSINITNGYVGLGTSTPAATLEVVGGIRMNTTTAKPTCDSTIRGTMWYYQAGAAVNDTLYACMKNSADAYNWVVVAIG